MRVQEEQLAKFLIDAGLIADGEMSLLRRKAEDQGRSLKDTVLADGHLGEDDVRRAEAYVLGIPFVNLKDEKIDFSILSSIPEPIARNHNIVAFKKTADTLEVAMLDVEDLAAIDFVKKKVGLRILPRLTDHESIRSALLQYQKSLKAEFGEIIEREAGAMKTLPESNEGEKYGAGDLKKLAEDLPIVRIVETLLKHAIVQNASDIHMEALENQFLIRYRIDGLLHDAMVLPKAAAQGITARIKVLANLKLDEKRLPQDGRFKIESDGEKVAFRVSTLPTNYGEKTVMRILRETVSGFTLESLGFHGEALERLHDAIKSTVGMILVTGPTGSGKTTTLYTVLDMLNTPDVNISTIEDPIEYQLPRINQTQVKPEIGFSFPEGLRTLVRQDPDIIMVGEIRDEETASLAVNAALTGHLVLSTLHTNSAAGTIPRLLDMNVEAFLLVSTIKIVVAQRLVRKLCTAKEKYFLSAEEQATLGKYVDMDRMLKLLKAEHVIGEKDTWEKVPFYHPKKSVQCEDGFAGRVGVHEVLPVTATIRELIMKRATAEEIEKRAKTEGMMSMLEDGIFLCTKGVTTIEEVLRVITE